MTVAKSDDITRLIEAMVKGGGARAETFFVSHGLGRAYSSVGKGWGTQKHVNAAIMQAERAGRLVEVVEAGLIAYELAPSESPSTHRTSRGGTVPHQISATSRLFISHASVDEELAEALSDLIRLGTGLSHERILCTSLEGMGIPVGTTDYLEFIRGQLSDAGLVLPLFTPAFFDSEACLIEIGAMWGLEMPRFPLLVPPVDYARVEELLGKIQGAKINQSKGLSDLHDRIVHTFGLTANTAMWERNKAKFEERLPELLERLAASSRVDAKDLTAAELRTTAVESQVAELEARVTALTEQNLALHAAKTADEAAAALAPHSEIERFEVVAQAASEAMACLSSAVRRALYEDLGQGQSYQPDESSGDLEDAERARREDLLAYDEDEGYSPNYKDPQVAEARYALDELFYGDWSGDFGGWFQERYRKRWTAESLTVWKALGLV